MSDVAAKPVADARAHGIELAFDGPLAEIAFDAGPLNLVTKSFLRALDRALDRDLAQQLDDYLAGRGPTAERS